ncbi:MAG: VWA domain-containing protein [Phycisphaerae bacterium]|nr:VWA domain-containing protein [Phycisphaerae bacterium]
MARQARQSRPQLVCVLADNSGSMAQQKAQAATEGIREMIMECQSRGPGGPDRSYFKLLLIRFGEEAVIDPLCDMMPIRMIDPDCVEIDGRGGDTDITGALELALIRLRLYMQGLQRHPERAEHPLPLVLLFSDGEHNLGSGPQPVAAEIKSLNLDGDPVVIAVAGVSVGNAWPDDKTLREIASPDCYVHITNTQALAAFISSVGSSGVSRARDVAEVIKHIQAGPLQIQHLKSHLPPGES